MNRWTRAAAVTGLAVLGTSLGTAAQAATSWGGMRDYSHGALVASGSGTYSQTATQERQLTHWQDRKADGHGAYVRANFDALAHTCYPDPAMCHWEWSTGTQKKTSKIGIALRDVDPRMDGRNAPEQGAMITEVQPGSRADDAGLRPGMAIVEAGGGLLIADADLQPPWLRDTLIPLLTDPPRLAQMSARAAELGRRDADERLADMVLEAARTGVQS